RLQIDAHLATREVRWVEIAEEEVGVGDGGLRAAEPVRCGTRVRSGAARADLEQPDLVHVRDAPAPRTDLDQLDRRDADGQSAALDEAPLARRLEAVRGERLAIIDEGELGRGPPHAEGGDARRYAAALVATEESGGDGARGRPRLEHLHGRALRLRYVGEAAAREHEEEGGGNSPLRHALGHQLEIA